MSHLHNPLPDAVLFHWRIESLYCPLLESQTRLAFAPNPVEHFATGRIWQDNKGRFAPDTEIQTSPLRHIQGNVMQTLNTVYELYGLGVHRVRVFDEHQRAWKQYFRLYSSAELANVNLLDVAVWQTDGYRLLA
ncbi:MAG: hypothetical protein Q4B82_08545 [Alysiella sp.]|uniref:hypothetical protein n=1 Tax=Alysiella sp. TaxID=1872483 RepID=UPI0026DDC671|nr:hypothetical protein [Alysiella sp.]MDO4434610.1 hypothetical protein [Alysiella sp.]